MGEKLDVTLGRIYVLILEEKNKNKNKIFKNCTIKSFLISVFVWYKLPWLWILQWCRHCLLRFFSTHNSSYKQNCPFQGDKIISTSGLMVNIYVLLFSGINVVKKFKASRFNIDEQLYKEGKINIQTLTKNKFLPKKVRENVGNPKELWKALKSLGLPFNITPVSQISLKDGENISFDEKTNSNSFKNFHANLALKFS